jgi:uroporphyrinogen III methyltransferase/synthase
MPGLVSFVSLGPGDPALRTVRAAERIAAADDVVAEPEGTAAQRLIRLAREGRRVVRAVEGDATVSVPVLREILAVAQAKVPFEIVPGVGARSAAAAFAGVVGKARRVAVSDVGSELAGEPPDAVVTLVAGVGSPLQRIVVTTAREAQERAWEFDATRIVVALGAPDESLLWFSSRPLFGKRVLVTRAREQAESAASLLRDAGADPIVVPTIVIAPSPDPGAVASAIARLREGAYAWVAFTSANGVDRAWEALVAAGGDARAFGGSRLAAIGPATAAALDRHGLRPDVIAKEFKGEGLADEMLSAMRSAQAPGRVLLARAAKARDVLPDALRAAGWTVDVAPVYETRAPDRSAALDLVKRLDEGRIDAVTLTSSSTVDNLCDFLGVDAARRLAGVRVASIGPVTTQTAVARGLRVDVTAPQSTLPGLVRALEASYA